MKTEKVSAVLNVEKAFAEFEAKSSAERAKLDQARAAADALQNQLDTWAGEREELANRIARGTGEIATSTQRVQILETHFENFWHELPMQEAIEEHGRQKFLLERMPDFISKWKARIAEIDRLSDAFKKSNGL